MKEDITKIVISYITKGISYIFLTPTVLIFLSMILFSLMNFHNNNMSFEFLKYLSFLNPKFGEGSFSINKEDIMQTFFFITFIIGIVFEVIKFTIEKKLNKKIKIKWFKITIMTLTTILIITLIITVIKIENWTGFFTIFIAFYIIGIINFSIYYGLNKLSEIIRSSKTINLKS